MHFLSTQNHICLVVYYLFAPFSHQNSRWLEITHKKGLENNLKICQRQSPYFSLLEPYQGSGPSLKVRIRIQMPIRTKSRSWKYIGSGSLVRELSLSGLRVTDPEFLQYQDSDPCQGQEGFGSLSTLSWCNNIYDS